MNTDSITQKDEILNLNLARVLHLLQLASNDRFTSVNDYQPFMMHNSFVH